MVKVIQTKPKMVTLVRGNKTIQRNEVDYKTNKASFDFRGFKLVKDLIKDKDDKILEFQPKAKNAKVKKTRRKSKSKNKKDI